MWELLISTTVAIQPSMKSRNKHTGNFIETKFEAINLPFAVSSLRHFLILASRSALYTHQQIADWTRRFWWECMEGKLAEHQNDELRKSAAVVSDIDTQWKLFLANTYSSRQLQNMDFSQVKLPSEWFENWRAELNSRTES